MFFLLLVIFVGTRIKKELFVEVSGNVGIFNGLVLLLLFGLILRWRYVRQIFSFITFLGCIASFNAIILVENSFRISWLVLFVAFFISFYLLSFSKDVRQYLEENTK